MIIIVGILIFVSTSRPACCSQLQCYLNALPQKYHSKIVNEYDQEIPQSQNEDYPVAPRGRAAQPPRDTRKTNQAKQSALSSPAR